MKNSKVLQEFKTFTNTKYNNYWLIQSTTRMQTETKNINN